MQDKFRLDTLGNSLPPWPLPFRYLRPNSTTSDVAMGSGRCGSGAVAVDGHLQKTMVHIFNSVIHPRVFQQIVFNTISLDLYDYMAHEKFSFVHKTYKYSAQNMFGVHKDIILLHKLLLLHICHVQRKCMMPTEYQGCR